MKILEQLALVALGGLGTALWYFIKRKVENTQQNESLDRHKKLLDIHKQMNEQGIDVAALKNIEEILSGKKLAIESRTAEIQSQVKPLINPTEGTNLTQLELIERARNSFEKAKERMQRAIGELDSRFDDQSSQVLMRSQTEWERYSVSQAESSAATYKDGSIYPLIYFSEMESLTNERAARLQAELDELRRISS